jgi:hypothetical protein
MRKLFSKKIVPVCALSKLFGVPSNFRIGLEKPKKKNDTINPKQTTIWPIAWSIAPPYTNNYFFFFLNSQITNQQYLKNKNKTSL